MPYIEHYQAVLDREQIPYDVTFFERYESGPTLTEKLDHGNEYTFRGETNANPISKLVPVFKYLAFVRKLIKHGEYNRLIVFTTMPAVLLSDLLLGKYRERYIFDYRDYTYEKFTFFAKRVSRIVNASAFTSFSSAGYLENFDITQEKYLLTHNITNLNCEVSHAVDLRKKPKLNIGFLGYVRYFDLNSRLISAFSNDPKYTLSYFGNRFSDCDLESFCCANNILNVSFHGPFKNEDKPTLYQQVDLINSIYSLESPEVKQAVPNRLYDAALYKKPIIVSSGTQLSEMVEKYGLGISVDPSEGNLRESVDRYVANFDSEKFECSCAVFLSDVEKDLQYHKERIKLFLV